MNRNPFHITYDDLIKQQESRLAYMERSYPKMKLEGSITAYAANHNIACVKTLLALLRKHKKNPQLNLQDMFETISKK